MIRRVLQSIRCHGEPAAVASRLIVGLGNVGSKYASTRHNLGFEVIDLLAKRHNASASRTRFDARIREAIIADRKVVLAAPTTMMNNSGFAVAQIVNWYKFDVDQVLIVFDEMDIAFGSIRLRKNGGSGGHNGVRSVIEQLGTKDFHRVRIGVGRPTSGSTIGFLLSRFSVEQNQLVPEIVSEASDAAEFWVRNGMEAAMNEYNRRGTGKLQGSAASAPQVREN